MPRMEPYHKALPYGYATGIFPAMTLLSHRPEQARRLLLHEQAQGMGLDDLKARCAALGIRSEVAGTALARISRKENCYAAVVFDKYETTLSTDAPHVVLHHPSDMGNLGTILRACLGFGLRNIALIRPAADVFDPRVIRASMGALFAQNIAYFDSFSAYRAAFSDHCLYPFCTDGSVPLSQAVAAKETPYSLVFGNEASGLPADIGGMGTPVRIAHSEEIDSLNLAVAVSIAAYAFTEEDFYG